NIPPPRLILPPRQHQSAHPKPTSKALLLRQYFRSKELTTTTPTNSVTTSNNSPGGKKHTQTSTRCSKASSRPTKMQPKSYASWQKNAVGVTTTSLPSRTSSVVTRRGVAPL